MKIIWLEDDPQTVRNTVNYIQDEIDAYIIICKSFAKFSQELYMLDDDNKNIIIIDIRMLFNLENEFSCFDKTFFIENELNAGFQYYHECLESKFSKTKIVFVTSKPFEEAKEDAKQYNIDVNLILTKDEPDSLLNFLKGEK